MIASLFAKIFLYGAPLLKFPAKQARSTPGPFPGAVANAAAAAPPQPRQRQQQQLIDHSLQASRLASCLPMLPLFFDYVLSLAPAEYAAFTAADWGRFILCVILGFRLSLPLAAAPPTPGWDHGAARAALGFGDYLDRLCRIGLTAEEHQQGGGAGGGGGVSGSSGVSGARAMDVVSATRAVLEVVRSKYHARVAVLEQQQQQTPAAAAAAAAVLPPDVMMDTGEAGMMMMMDRSVCPALDGSLDAVWRTWEVEGFADLTSSDGGDVPGLTTVMGPGGGGGGSMGPSPAGFHDLWATMTLGWGKDETATPEVEF